MVGLYIDHLEVVGSIHFVIEPVSSFIIEPRAIKFKHFNYIRAQVELEYIKNIRVDFEL